MACWREAMARSSLSRRFADVAEVAVGIGRVGAAGDVVLPGGFGFGEAAGVGEGLGDTLLVGGGGVDVCAG
jgi:hypothetical protein